jgi:hypothetical protein
MGGEDVKRVHAVSATDELWDPLGDESPCGRSPKSRVSRLVGLNWFRGRVPRVTGRGGEARQLLHNP